VLAVTALTYSHVVFHNEKTGYVKLSFVWEMLSTVLVEIAN
jgi:hypothetical protein